MTITSNANGEIFGSSRRRFAPKSPLSRFRPGATNPLSGAKGRSGDRVRFDSEWGEELREQRAELIRTTISHRSWETHFQPIVDLKKGDAVGTEALSRFALDPSRSPDTWFAEAAEVGLGVDLEVAALEAALEQLPRVPPKLYLSLNASVETIMSEDFAGTIADVPAERIVLELTEHERVTDYLGFEQGIETLRSRGVRLAVDDTGAGFSSLQHILNLRPDVIKLDIGLTRGIDKDPARRALGRALLTFGLDAYNASIVAEGIETVGELETLQALGCPCGQGYYLGRPGRLGTSRWSRPTRTPHVFSDHLHQTDLPLMMRELLDDLDHSRDPAEEQEAVTVGGRRSR